MSKNAVILRLCAVSVAAVALLGMPATATAATSSSTDAGTTLALLREPEGCVNPHNPLFPYPQTCIGTTALIGLEGEEKARGRAQTKLEDWELFNNVNCNGQPDLYTTLPRENGTQFNIDTICYPRDPGFPPLPEPQPGTDTCPVPVSAGDTVTCPAEPPVTPPVASGTDDCALFPEPGDVLPPCPGSA